MLKRFALNVVSNWVAMVVRIGSMFFLLPFLVHRLGEEVYGIWAIVASFLAYASLLDMGLTMSVKRFTAQYSATGNWREQNQLMSSATLIYGCAAVLVSATAVIFAPFIPTVFSGIPSEAESDAVLLFYIAAGLAFLRFAEMPLIGFLQGIQRYDAYNAGSILAVLVRLGLTVTLVQFVSARILWLGVAAVAAMIIEVVLLAALAFKYCPSLKLSAKLISKKQMQKIAGFGASTFLLTISGLVIFSSPPPIIGALVSTAAVTAFGLGFLLMQTLREAISAVGNVLVPMFSASAATEEHEQVRERLIKLSQVCNMLASVAIAIVVAYAQQILELWTGKVTLANEGYWPAVVLMGSQIFVGTDYVLFAAMAGYGEMKWMVVFQVISALVTIGGAFVLISCTELGILGMAIAIAVPMIVRNGIWLPLYTCYSLKLSARHYFGKAILRPLVATLPLAAVAAVVAGVQSPKTRAELVIQMGILGILGLATVFRLGIEKPVRQRLWSSVRTPFGRRPRGDKK